MNNLTDQELTILYKTKTFYMRQCEDKWKAASLVEREASKKYMNASEEVDAIIEEIYRRDLPSEVYNN